MGNIQGKQMVVSAIQNGTVIDHIPSKNLFKVISILKLENIDLRLIGAEQAEQQRIHGAGMVFRQIYVIFVQDSSPGGFIL